MSEIKQQNNFKDLNEQEVDFRSRSLERLTSDFNELIIGSDILEKAEFSRDDFLLLAGGIKPAIDFEFPQVLMEELKEKNEVHDNDLNDFKARLEKMGLKISTLENVNGILHAFIYNPGLLALRSQTLEALIPFSEVDDLNTWIEDNIDTNINRDMIFGGLYGFPQSSIDAYIAYKRDTKSVHQAEKFGSIHERKIAKELLKVIREEKRHFIQSYGESYLVDDPRAEDVLEYENIKREFFEKLQASQDFWNALGNLRRDVEANEGKISWEVK